MHLLSARDVYTRSRERGGRSPAGIKARDGRLWFPTQDGVAVIDPEAVPINQQPPPVVIESVKLDRATVAFDHPVRVAPGHEDLEIGILRSDQRTAAFLLRAAWALASFG